MLTIDEIYYLNKALDGKKIYGINKNINEEDKEQKIVNNLINQEILNQDGSLNQLSFHIIRSLEQYKNASKYLWINDIIFSMDKTDYLVVLKKENEKEMTFAKTTKELLLLAIVKEYKFLWDNYTTEDDIKKIPLDYFTQNILLKRKERKDLYIRKEIENKPYLYNIYYEEGQNVFKYNILREELKKINPKDAREELAKILEN